MAAQHSVSNHMNASSYSLGTAKAGPLTLALICIGCASLQEQANHSRCDVRLSDWQLLDEIPSEGSQLLKMADVPQKRFGRPIAWFASRSDPHTLLFCILAPPSTTPLERREFGPGCFSERWLFKSPHRRGGEGNGTEQNQGEVSGTYEYGVTLCGS